MTSRTKHQKNMSSQDLCEVALGAVCICLCAWITIPTVVPFTLQTFAVFFVLLVLGGKKGLLSILCYILMGLIGLPVYSGFQSGLGIFLGPTGGFIFGFLLIALCYLVFEKYAGCAKRWEVVSLFVGLTLCYFVGCLWFMQINLRKGITYGFMKVASVCVLPFLIPDGVKLALAFLMSKKVKKAMTR